MKSIKAYVGEQPTTTLGRAISLLATGTPFAVYDFSEADTAESYGEQPAPLWGATDMVNAINGIPSYRAFNPADLGRGVAYIEHSPVGLAIYIY